MASGRPDYYNSMVSIGKYDSTYVPLAVDASGNIVSLMKGAYDSTLKTIKLDDAGRIIGVIRDPSNDRYLGIDASGNIVAVIKGDYSGALKTLAVDTDGVLKANLTSQDLNFLTVRPAYSQTVVDSGTEVISASSTETIITVSGRGIVLGGWFVWGIGQTHLAVEVGVKTDGTLVEEEAVSVMNGQYHYTPGCQPLYLLKYDDDNFTYTVGISAGLTFETSIDITIKNPYGFEVTVIYHFFYALVP